MVKIVTTAQPGSPEWIAARKGKIGGSDAASILCGHLPDVRVRGTALSVWERIRRELSGEDVAAREDDSDFALADDDAGREEADILWWGKVSEPVHRQALARDTGWGMTEPPGVIQHDEFEWFAGSPDGGVVRPNYPEGVLEMKAPAFAWTRAEWTSGVPMAYQIQAACYMILWGRPWALVSAFTPPSRPLYDVVPLAPHVEDWILEGLERFWRENVQADVPPPVASHKDYEIARSLFSRAPEDRIVLLSPEGVAASQRAEELGHERKALEQEIERLKAQVLLEIGDAKWGLVGDGFAWRHDLEGATVGRKEIVQALLEAGHEEAAMLAQGLEKKAKRLRRMKGVS